MTSLDDIRMFSDAIFGHIKFDDKYNDPKPLMNYVTHVEFGDSYNQDTPLPHSIKYNWCGDTISMYSL